MAAFELFFQLHLSAVETYNSLGVHAVTGGIPLSST